MVGVKASNGNHGQSGGPGRGLWRDDGERAPPGGPAEAGAAASEGRDDGERAPPGGSAEARASTMVVRDDGQCRAMSREQVAKSRSEAKRVTGTAGIRVAS